MKFLLDYFFPITAISPTPSASTAFLKQVCVVVKPKDSIPSDVLTLCTTIAQVSALTDNEDVEQLFNAGMSRVYVYTADDLDLADAMAEDGSLFFTVLISSDFADSEVLGEGEIPDAQKASLQVQEILYTAKTAGTAGNSISITYTDTATAGSESASATGSAITVEIDSTTSTATQVAAALQASAPVMALIDYAIDTGQGAVAQETFATDNLEGGTNNSTATIPMDLGVFNGVVGLASTDDSFLEDQAVIENRCAFKSTSGNGSKSLFFAFGKLLSNALSWRNQQYITMPLSDDVDTLGEANEYFDSKISFVISDSEFGNRLALFACGSKAIVAPYITKNLEIDIQSAALSYISGNQPGYTKTQAALLEDELQKVIDLYIERALIELGVIEVELEQSNFVASGYINMSEPKALWRIFGELRQTL